MKRGQPLKRKMPLRSHGSLKRDRPETPLSEPEWGKVRAPLSPGKPRRRVKIPPDVRARVLDRSKRKCIVCGRRVRLQLHHVLPQQKWPHLALEADNMVGICPEDHADHEAAARRIPRAKLPPCAIALAHREGVWWYIERTYPDV